jgi:ATP:cob(I)alamin adenosyltransferase
MKIYTKGGDKGRTAIIGSRVEKDDIRIEANGILDEVVSHMGVLRMELPMDHVWQLRLKDFQWTMMDLMGVVATPSDQYPEGKENIFIAKTEELEKWIDELEAGLSTVSDHFVLPGGTKSAAQAHVVRARLRTAERRLVTLNKQDNILEGVLPYVNRMSDLFYSLSRFFVEESGLEDENWRLFIPSK